MRPIFIISWAIHMGHGQLLADALQIAPPPANNFPTAIGLRGTYPVYPGKAE
jgi:hypothetical protein